MFIQTVLSAFWRWPSRETRHVSTSTCDTAQHGACAHSHTSVPIVSDDCPEPRTSTVCGRGRARPENHKSCKQRARRKALRIIIYQSCIRMRHKSDGEARPARCHDRPACLAPRRRLEVQLQDFQIFFALRGAAQLANRGIRRGGARKLCRASACGGICDCRRPRASLKSATPDNSNSPAVPTSSSDAATRCRATRNVASQW